MKNIELLCITILMVVSSNVLAVSINSNTKIPITGMVIYSNNDTDQVAYSGLVSVQFSTITWSQATTVCSTTGVLVKKGDKNLLSSLLAASMSNKQIQIHVDPSVTPLAGTCFLRAISM